MKLYIVCWANATQDDNGNNRAYGNVWKAYKTIEEAKAGLEECKNEFIEEILQCNEDDESEDIIEVYGSVDTLSFEIYNDWCCDTTYIRISEIEI